MLSSAAWNAFLKTLEEPPPDTVFVLATTEAQKVPATVVDRCHRFDFQRPTVEQIAERRAPRRRGGVDRAPAEAAAAAIARSATGSFRDALGTLEQLVTYSGKKSPCRRARRARRGRRRAARRDVRRRRRRRRPPGDARGRSAACEGGRDAGRPLATSRPAPASCWSSRPSARVPDRARRSRPSPTRRWPSRPSACPPPAWYALLDLLAEPTRRSRPAPSRAPSSSSPWSRRPRPRSTPRRGRCWRAWSAWRRRLSQSPAAGARGAAAAPPAAARIAPRPTAPRPRRVAPPWPPAAPAAPAPAVAAGRRARPRRRAAVTPPPRPTPPASAPPPRRRAGAGRARVDGPCGGADASRARRGRAWPSVRRHLVRGRERDARARDSPTLARSSSTARSCTADVRARAPPFSRRRPTTAPNRTAVAEACARSPAAT